MSIEDNDRDPEHCGSQACLSTCGCGCSECRDAVKVISEIHEPCLGRLVVGAREITCQRVLGHEGRHILTEMQSGGYTVIWE